MNQDAALIAIKVFPEGQPAQRLDVSEKILAFDFEDEERKADKLVLSIDNEDLSNFDNPIWRKGNIVEFSWGYRGSMTPTRRAVIKSVKGFQTLSIEAHGAVVLMNRIPRTRSFSNQTRAAVVELIAQENGFGLDNIDIEETGVVYPVITQARLTDAQFIKRLALRESFEFYVDHTGFHFHKRRLNQRPARKYIWKNDPGGGDVTGISIENDVTARPGKVRVQGRDPMRKADINEEATKDNTKRTALGSFIEIVDTATGETTLTRRAAVEATKTTSEPETAGARRVADGAYEKAQEATVRMELSLVGDPLVAAKRIIEIDGIGQRMSGLYYVKKAKHKIGQGYSTVLTCMRNAHGGYSQSGLTDALANKQNKKKAPNKKEPQPKEVINESTGESYTVFVEGGEDKG